MATTANQQAGATPASGMDDPFTASAHTPLRYAPLDTEQISLYSTNSPSQARRALEAHLKDTDRRIQDASRLGTTLLQQRKDLSARLDEVKHIQQDNEVPAELRKKLADLEKEYNEVGKESARAFLPKNKATSAVDVTGTPSAFTGSGRESPTKLTAPSRRQRNQPNNRVHDIEFATEISTSLLAQVRQLQAALAEKDEVLRDATTAKAELESDLAGMAQRMKHMDENEQRYKDENWNLETRLQELEGNFKLSSDKEQRTAQSLQTTQTEKAAAQRDLDDLKASHERLNEDHAAVKRQQESDLHVLRRDVASYESEKQRLQRKVEELTSQNTELAKAMSYRWNQPSAATDTEFVSADEDLNLSDGTPENSEPASPVKGTPRHGMLESETLKSSLSHAHRMIQNLKNNIHREKTEKIELKRMLQDARDELETRRGESGIGANMVKKRKGENDGKFKRPLRPSGLGASRESTTEIFDDEPDWEDHDGPDTPSRSRDMLGVAAGVAVGAASAAALGSADDETTDAFETATEREGTTTDSFETGRESMGEEDSDQLTETESGANRGSVIRKGPSPLTGARPGDRRSFLSTASTSADEDEDDDVLRTPSQTQHPKYKLRMNRGSKRYVVSDLASESQAQPSPSSSMGTPQPAGQSLGDELDAMDEGSVGGTPSRYSESTNDTPQTQRLRSVEPETPEHLNAAEVAGAAALGLPSAAVLVRELGVSKPVYSDAGVMTDPWEPESVATSESNNIGLREKAEEVVGGALAGFGLGWLSRNKDDNEASDSTTSGTPERPTTALGSARADELEDDEGPTAIQPVPFTHSEIFSQETTPVESIRQASLAQSAVVSQETTPVADSGRVIAQQKPLAHSEILSQETTPISPPVTRAVADIPAAFEPAAVVSTATPTTTTEAAPDLGFSSIVAQGFEPDLPNKIAPSLPERSMKRHAFLYVPPGEPVPEQSSSVTDNAQPAADQIAPTSIDVGTNTSPSSRNPLGEVDPNIQSSQDASIPTIQPLQVKKPVVDEGSQTAISGEEIESLIKNKSAPPVIMASDADVGTSPGRPSTAIRPSSSRSVDVIAIAEESPFRSTKRPGSSNSMRNNKGFIVPPPLPEDHTQKIAAAQKTPGSATAGAMGPPSIPASAYKHNRPGTPGGRAVSRDGPTPRAGRVAAVRNSPRTGTSRRSSVSSFASELDERFNLQHGNSNIMYPDDIKPTTDPRMIQAITQTMIGEYLWKYTRKAGRSETSSSRHRRFFWVHPYTRTLYWSEKDPSAAGRDMLKAKSVAIESVRVITDDNTYPPGLHRKSLVVVTPGREIVFTAPTGQRHETWFNALSYLLLRTEQEKMDAEELFNQEDVEEFNPGVGSSIRRSLSRFTGGRSQSRVSLSSYNSRTTRNSSPTRIVHDAPTLVPSLAQRQSAGAARTLAVTTPEPGTTMRQSTKAEPSAGRGRLSSITQKFSTNTRGRSLTARGRASFGTRPGQPSDPSDIYDASVVDDSAEDLRAVIERQEQQSDRVENVRACCDGKHDVGSLSHTHKHHSLTSRS